jgi:hypothetical protein
MGNHPSVDLMVRSRGRVRFGIDVKGLYRRNYWLVSVKTASPDLFYVLAFVPENAHNQFFVLSQEQVNQEVTVDTETARLRALAKGRIMREGFTGISFPTSVKYEDAWETLPR